jgi:hypothetical protein
MPFLSFPTGRFPRRQPINVGSPASRFGLKLAFSYLPGVASIDRCAKGLAKPVRKVTRPDVDVVLGQPGNLIGSQS